MYPLVEMEAACFLKLCIFLKFRGGNKKIFGHDFSVAYLYVFYDLHNFSVIYKCLCMGVLCPFVIRIALSMFWT